MKKRLLLLSIIGIFNIACLHAQKDPFQKYWKEIEAFMEKGLPKSASEVAQQVLNLAQEDGNSAQAIKAQLFLMEVRQATEEGGQEQGIQEAEAKIEQSEGLEQALWQSIAAEHYWNYFQRNRWKIYQRTPVEGAPSTDIAVWSADLFFKRISNLYVASISQDELLQKTPVAQFAPLIDSGRNTRKLRPSMYDLLVFRALDFFQNDEKDLNRPADSFQIEDARWFDPAPSFVKTDIDIPDSTSLQALALRLYQKILKHHLDRNQTPALIDAELHRLSFIYDKSVHPEKDSLYLNALRTFESTYSSYPESAEAAFRIAHFLYSEGRKSPAFLRNNNSLVEGSTRDLPSIRKQLQAIVSKYPKTEGASHALLLLRDIEDQNIYIQTEQVQVPHTPFRALLQYRNTKQIYLHLFRVPSTVQFASTQDPQFLEEFIKTHEPVWTSIESMPGISDLESHSAEVKIDAQKPGFYILAASLHPNLKQRENIISSTSFQVSSIAIITQRKGPQTWLYTLDRQSGKPIPEVNLQLWKRDWDNKNRKYQFKQSHQANSDHAGVFSLENTDDFQYITLIKNQDTLHSPLQYRHISSNTTKPDKPTERSFFFTDRSIYRPGQTIYFKGILLESHQGGIKNNTISDRNLEVSLYNANGQKVHTLNLKTNQYGSFTGTFIAPTDAMQGNMQIRSNTGSAQISVEEYKRPSFYLEFDTLKGQYALEEEITIQGNALAYAGNKIQDAQVRYRVIRTARFPYLWASYRWGGLPTRSPQTEISSGLTQTDANGRFSISFTSIPDKSISPERLPVFNYKIIAEITDINGETQSMHQDIPIGYRSLQISSNIPEEVLASQLDTLHIQSLNLHNQFSPTTLTLQIKPLIFPGKLYRERLWELPDQFLYTEAQFREYFPEDAYRQENDYHYWESASPIYAHTWETQEDGLLHLPQNIWEHTGWYIFEISGKDAQGNSILDKQYAYVLTNKPTKQAQVALTALSDKNTYKPGEQAKINIEAGYKDAYILEANTLKDTLGTKVDASSMDYSLDITENDRGGITYSWIYVYHNRVYQASKTLEIPWSERDLHIAWSSHRSTLRPGDEETWTFTIRGNKQEAITSEMLATLYDASLDSFKPHQWNWSTLTPQGKTQSFWNTYTGFGIAPYFFHQNLSTKPLPPSYIKAYDRLITYGYSQSVEEVQIRRYGPGNVQAPITEKNTPLFSQVGQVAMPSEARLDAAPPLPESEAAPDRNEALVPLRTNLQETAFFLPQIQSNEKGEVQFSFTAPEALTTWRLMTFAHTPDWKTGFLEGKVQTQKELMVTPNLPRFFRQGDQISISSKIDNLSPKALQGKAHIEILDALSMQSIEADLTLKETEQGFQVEANGSTSLTWTFQVPEDLYTPIILRISANSGDFTDGEEHVIPVVSNRTLVTETLPLWIHGNQEKSITWEAFDPGKSTTLSPHKLSLEFTGNPAWYAVQALPYLKEAKYESAENIFNRYYANALAAYITRQNPQIQSVFEAWATNDSSQLQSPLAQNQELKSLLLEETPWVGDAENASQQMRNIKMLFEQERIQRELRNTLSKLLDVQLDNGSFPWFKGMYQNRYITHYILTGTGRLKAIGALQGRDPDLDGLLQQALAFADEQLQADYTQLMQSTKDLDAQHISYNQILYLYMRSFFTDQAIPESTRQAFDYYKDQAARYWNAFNPYMKGQIALALYRFGNVQIPQEILASLKETAVVSEEFGMYWKQIGGGYLWHQAPVEAQAQLIEAFSEITPGNPLIDDLRIWLLKQKQTQHWRTSKSTADACYALLLQGTNWLQETPNVQIQLGNESIQSTLESTVPGSGYFKKTFEAEEIEPEMQHLRIQVDKAEDTGTAWGGLFWQYFEDLDKIESAETPLSIRKSLYLQKNTPQGPLLTAINSKNTLHVGDKVIVRIEIRVDRDMEYVHLKDMRAATFEPINVLSTYKSQGGQGYMENTRDLSTNFFFDYLRKGTYVFEYPVYVRQKGNFSNGIANIQSMYAPEFSSHSAGIRVQVE